jgi:hypothetical protein
VKREERGGMGKGRGEVEEGSSPRDVVIRVSRGPLVL